MKTHHSNPKLVSVSLSVLLSAFSFFISPAEANAQFGIRVDAGVSRYAATDLSDVSVANYFGPGIQAGVNYDIHVKGKFFITPALTWSMRSETARDPSTLAKETVHEHFLNLPVHVKWIFEIKPEKFAIYCYGGPVFSYGLSSRASVETFVNSRFFDATYDYYSGKADVDFSPLNVDATTEAELDAMLQAAADEEGLLRTRFEARFDAGVGFRFADHYELILGSDFGMTNRNKGTLSTAVTLMTSYYYIGFTYRFGNRK